MKLIRSDQYATIIEVANWKDLEKVMKKGFPNTRVMACNSSILHIGEKMELKSIWISIYGLGKPMTVENGELVTIEVM